MGILRPVRAPVFEIGPKGYLWGPAALALATATDAVATRLDVDVIYDPQVADLAACAAATSRIHVWAQHVDPLPPGRGHGSILAEAVRTAGATGVLLNHVERRLSPADLAASVARAHEAGLQTLVFADTPEEAGRYARDLRPAIVLAEPPSLIGTGQSAGAFMADFVAATVEAVKGVDPGILVMSGAGVSGPDDVERMIELGLDGTGASSGICKAPDPAAVMTSMLEALARAWARAHPTPRKDSPA